MKKRKQRLVVELTTSRPVTQKEARLALSLLLERIDLEAKPVWPHHANDIYAEKLTVKEYERVFNAELKRQAWRI